MSTGNGRLCGGERRRGPAPLVFPLILALWAAYPGPGAPAADLAPRHDTPRTIARLPMIRAGELVAVPARINGTLDGAFLIGASQPNSLLSDGAAQALGLRPQRGADGQVDTVDVDGKSRPVVTVRQLRLGDLTEPDVPFAIVPGSMLRSFGLGDVIGVLGQAVLAHVATMFDFKAGAVELVSPGGLTPSDLARLGMAVASGVALDKDSDGSWTVTVQLSDTASASLPVNTTSDSTIISPTDAKTASAGDDETVVKQGLTGRPVRLRVVRLRRLRIADQAVSGCRADVADEGGQFDPCIGLDVLSHFEVLLDPAARKLYLRPRDAGAGRGLDGSRTTARLPMLRPHDLLAVRARLNGKLDGEFMLDSGTSVCLLTTSAARALALVPDQGAGRPLVTADVDGKSFPAVMVQRVELGDLTETSVPFAVVPDAMLQLPGAGPIGGMFGQPLLARFATLLDFKASAVELLSPADLAPSDLAGVGMADATAAQLGVDDSGRWTATVQLSDEVSARLVLDSGSDITIIPQTAAEMVSGGWIGLQPEWRVGGRAARLRVVKLKRFQIGDRTLLSQVVDVADPKHGFNAILGLDILSHFKVLLDPAAGKLYLKRPDAAPETTPAPHGSGGGSRSGRGRA